MDVLRQRVLAKLASDTALLVSAERHRGVEVVHAVDPDGAGLEPVGGADGLVEVAGEDGGSETVDGVVRLVDDVVLVLELDDDTDGAEDLLLDNLHVRLDVGEDGRLDEVALGADTGTAVVERRALLLARLDVAHDALCPRVSPAGWLCARDAGVPHTGPQTPAGPGSSRGRRGRQP